MSFEWSRSPQEIEEEIARVAGRSAASGLQPARMSGYASALEATPAVSAVEAGLDQQPATDADQRNIVPPIPRQLGSDAVVLARVSN